MADEIEGFILMGGQSSRMGADKSRLKIEGVTFAELIALALAPVTRSIRAVGNEAQDLGLSAAADIFPGWGALGGLHAALAACQAEWSLVVACDLPFVTTSLLTRLAQSRPGFEAVAPRQADGYLQPLCALYRVDPCLETCETLIKSGERKPVALLEAVKSRFLGFAELSDLIDADRFFDNINTPEDYDRAKRRGAGPSVRG
jgi:molybdopterin-guanine dinucleotide biosynthesis protein A